MADFLARLAGRTLGLAPTVQPVLAPMYAPGKQFVGAEDAQEGIRDAWGAVNRVTGAINRAPMPGAATAYPQRSIGWRGMSLQDGLPEPSSGNLVGETVRAPEMLLPLVPQENQPSIISIQTPHTASKTPDGQPATWHRISLERDEAASPPGLVPVSSEDQESAREVLSLEQSTIGDHKAPHTYKESEVGHDGPPQGPLQVPQGNRVVETTLVPPVVDVLSVQRPAESKAIRPQQDSSLVGLLEHPYSRVNKHEVAPVTQESFTPALTIQVTIGRIEVRAMPPANARPQPRRSEPPVMGLEEYLNQRAKGDR